MVAANTDHTPDLIAETLYAFKNTPPAIECVANFEELSPGLRGENFSPDDILRNIQEALEQAALQKDSGEALKSLQSSLTLSPSDLYREVLFEGWLNSELTRLAKSLPAGKEKDLFMDASLPTRERLQVLEHVTEKRRMSFASALLTLHETDDSYQNFIADKLDNTLAGFSAEDRGTLIKEVLRQKNVSAVPYILRSSNSLHELSTTVAHIGEKTLLSLGQDEVTELVAQAVLTPEIQKLRFDLPKDLSSKEALDKAYETLTEAYKAVPQIIGQHPELRHTRTASQYLGTYVSSLIELQEGAVTAKLHPESYEELLLRNSKIASLEFHYGVDLSAKDSMRPRGIINLSDVCTLSDLGVSRGGEENFLGDTSVLSPHIGHWDLKHLAQVEEVLKRMPEAEMLFTARLNRIELVADLDYLGGGVLGVRYENGVIQISELSLDHDGISASYEGVPSLNIVLAHEIGHGIQIGDGPSGIYYPKNGDDPYFGKGEEIHDFDEWIKLSGWKVYDRERYSAAEKPGYIVLDGETVKLGEAIAFQGENIVLTYNFWGNVLESYDADSEFSNRWYAKTSPWEDFAEAFSEYLFLPERLIKDAPKKFQHLDLEFRRYAEDKKLQEQLETRLAQEEAPQEK